MQDLETPRMVYRAGGNVLLESGAYSTRIVADQAELSEALADGWHLDQYAAKAALDATKAATTQPAAPQPTQAAEPARTKRPYNRKAAA